MRKGASGKGLGWRNENKTKEERERKQKSPAHNNAINLPIRMSMVLAGILVLTIHEDGRDAEEARALAR